MSERGKVMKPMLSMKLFATFLVCLHIIGMAGCKNSPYSMPNFGETQSNQQPQADPRLTNSTEAKFFSQSGMQACAGGAFIGILGCQLSNATDKDDCMLKAAFVGCGVGMGANYYYDYRRSEYAKDEQLLDTMIADVREDNRKLQNLNRTAKSVLAEDKKELAKIKEDIANNTVNTGEANRTLHEIDANTKYLQSTLSELRKREKEWRSVAAKETNSGARLDTLNAEINKMNRQIAQLESDIDELFMQRSAIQLG
jgi:archaellum component FlaC